MALTGRFDFRRTMTGHLRLCLEYESNGFWDFLTRKKTYCRRWRNANIMDLAAPELRHLLDRRFARSLPPPQALRDWPINAPEREAALTRMLIAPPKEEHR
jgi:hypothetical protein